MNFSSKTAFLFLYVFAISIFLIHFLVVGKAVYGDGRYYYAYLPTLLLQHTLNFSKSFQQLGIQTYLTPNHLPANKYSPGSALLWGFSFSFIHLLLMPFHLNDGYNSIYQIAIGIGNVSLVFIGLYFLWKSLFLFFSKSISLITCIFIFLSTNLLFYGAVDVINSHSGSFFASALFIYFWLQKKTYTNAVLMGFFLGLLILIRAQDIIFIILPCSNLILEKRKYIFNFAMTIITATIMFFPQLLLWKLEWGSWLTSPYLSRESFQFIKPQFLGVLFYLPSGLFLWTPITIGCLMGLFYFIKIKRNIAIPFLLIFFVQLYIVASWSTWWQGASYSGRMFVSTLPMLSFGLAFLLSQKKCYIKVFLLSSFLSILNPLLIILFLKLH